VTIAGRTAERAQELAGRVGGKAVAWNHRHVHGVQILVNCTPVGMHPNVDAAPFEKHHLKPSMIVFDTVYNPETTLLVRQARERQCRVITGVDMFVRQAARQFQLFTGRDASTDLMRQVVKRAIGPVKYE
jgi:3-dehydroquinate dehydratase/shikimate dehydrogenase